MPPTQRPRRNRKSQSIRDLTAETQLNIQQIIYPVFVTEGQNTESAIKTLPGQSRWTPDLLSKKIAAWKTLGITHYALFPQIPESKKNSRGTEALNNDGLLPQTIKRLKDDHPDINLVTDVALDPFSSDGHDGLVENGKILNDESVEILAQMALKQAEWGADWVAPSDMMDGRIGAIRKTLDRAGYIDTNILAYSAKYASCFYGPFRDALQSAPKFGDKKTYQMDPRNAIEALREARLDIAEGADMVMVKPALAYLDIIQRIKKISTVPVAAYNVSGEYAMLKAAAQLGSLDENRAILETMHAFRRAGADVILTYFAPQLAHLLRK
jgi:porphobilinogen synthase